MTDFEESIQVTRLAIEKMGDDDPSLAAHLNTLGNLLGEKYSETEELGDLEEANRITKQAIDITPFGHAKWAEYMNNLGVGLGQLYAHTGEMPNLIESIQVTRQAVNATLDENTSLPRYLNNLGSRIADLYAKDKVLSDLEEAILIARRAIETTPIGSSDLPFYLNNLGDLLDQMYTETEKVSDLEEALQFTRRAIQTASDSDPDLPTYLHNLMLGLHKRYSAGGEISDLNESIQTGRRVIDMVPDSDPNLSKYLTELGVGLDWRYTKLGNISDLEQVIQVIRHAIALADESDPELPRYLSNLGIGLGKRYADTEEMSTLEEAIEVTMKAVELTPDGCSTLPQLLHSLGSLLDDRYSKTQKISDLREAIRVERQAVDAERNNDADRAIYLHSLGQQLGEKHLKSASIDSLDEAILVTRQAAEMVPDGGSARATYLHSLGCHLQQRFVWAGVMADLEESIRVIYQAINTVPATNPDVYYLYNLGIGLSTRYSRTNRMTDIEEAIKVLRQAIDTTADDHVDRITFLTGLGSRLGLKYTRTEDINDLNESIQLLREALATMPSNYPDPAEVLCCIGTQLSRRYLTTAEMVDLDEAIQSLRQAVEKTPEGHPERAKYLNNLGVQISHKYVKTEAMVDLDDALRVARQAVHATPDGHFNLAMHLNNLGGRLINKYSKTDDVEDLEEAIACFQSALDQSSSSTINRIHASALVIELCSNPQQAYKASRDAVRLIPRLISRSLQHSDKQHALAQIFGIASDAASAAIRVGESPIVALDLIEQGRGLLGASLNEMRIDISDLQEQHPLLADRFIRLRNQWETPSPPSVHSLEQRGKLPSRAFSIENFDEGEKEFDELVDEIRKQPGFSAFLRPPSEQEMIMAAKCGPIAVINVGTSRCDALLVEEHQIRVLPLHSFHRKDLDWMLGQDDPASPQVLEWLWDAIANPVLTALGFTHPPSDQNWPRMWWIPTGLLTLLPLHAAGYHSRRSSETVLDRVMSSYGSSIRAIIHSRQRSGPDLTLSAETPVRALLVAMENTPAESKLPYAASEITMLRTLCKSIPLDVIEPTPQKQDILESLSNCKLFHFAGHGYTDKKDPSKSQLLLDDWQHDPLTVASLLQINLQQHPPFLAYLSACGTGQIKEDRFGDESIHLINACQLLGFRHVIGTLWEVNDETCVDMARITYEELRDQGMSDESVCLGLHRATRELRDRWLIAQSAPGRSVRTIEVVLLEDGTGTEISEICGADNVRVPRKVILCEEETERAHWVPYVHFGV